VVFILVLLMLLLLLSLCLWALFDVFCIVVVDLLLASFVGLSCFVLVNYCLLYGVNLV